MPGFFDLFRWTCTGFVVVLALGLILMHLPNSPLKTLAERAMAGIFALLMPVYLISPVDLAPEVVLGPIGLIDDIVVLVAGVASGRYALYGPKKSEKP